MTAIDEKRSVVGLKDLYVALVTQDDADGYLADTPQAFAPAMNASHKPTSNSEIQYANDEMFDILTVEAETKLEMEVTAIPLEIQALVLGKYYDNATGRMFDNGGQPPDVALSFRSIKSNGKYKYFQYLKGKFSAPDEEQATKADKPAPKSTKIAFTAVKTMYAFEIDTNVYDGVKRVVGDEDISGFSGTTWFDAVQVPVLGTPSAIALSSITPVNAATNVVVTTTVVLVFNNAIRADALDGIVLFRADNWTAVSCETAQSSDGKTVTLTPGSSLTANKEYDTVIAGVADIYGQALATAVKHFTTAA